MSIKWLQDSYVIDSNLSNKFNRQVGILRGHLSDLVDVIAQPDFFESLSQWFIKPNEWLSALLYFPISFKMLNPEHPDKYLNIATLQTDVRCFNLRNYYSFNIGQYYFEPHFNNFADYNGYTKINVFLPYHGFVELNPNDVMGKYVYFRLKIDTYTGQGMYIISVGDKSVPSYTDENFDYRDDIYGRILTTITTQIGVQVPLGSSNQGEIIRNLILGASKTALNVSSALITKNPTPIITETETVITKTQRNPKSGRQNVMSTESTSEKQTKTQTPRTSKKFNAFSEAFDGSIDALSHMTLFTQVDRPNNSVLFANSPTNVIVVIYRPKINEIDTITGDYAHSFGLPFAKNTVLSRLSGFTKIGTVHIEGEGFNKTTQGEMSMIEDILAQGIILPRQTLLPPTLSLEDNILYVYNSNEVRVQTSLIVDGSILTSLSSVNPHENIEVDLSEYITDDGVYTINVEFNSRGYENSLGNAITYVKGDYYYGQYRFKNTLTTTELDNNIIINFTNSGVSFRGVYGDRSALGYLGAEGSGISIYITYYNSGYQPSGGSVGWQSSSAQIINIDEPQLITDTYSKEWLDNNLIKI